MGILSWLFGNGSPTELPDMVPGGLNGLDWKCFDFTLWTHDTTTDQLNSDRQQTLVELAASCDPTHIGVSFPVDPLSWYPVSYDPLPLDAIPYYQSWVNTIRASELKVLHRPVLFGLEGSNGFLKRVGAANRYYTGTPSDIIPLPGVNFNSLLGIFFQFIVNNSTLFADGDLWAPLPNMTLGLSSDSTSFLPAPLPTTFVTFMADLKTVCDYAFSVIGKNVVTGLTSNAYADVANSYLPQEYFDNAGITVVDYFGNYNNSGYEINQFKQELMNIYTLRGKPIFLQAWGTTPALLDLIDPINHDLTRGTWLTNFYNMLADLANTEILKGFNYYGFWDNGDHDTGIIERI